MNLFIAFNACGSPLVTTIISPSFKSWVFLNMVISVSAIQHKDRDVKRRHMFAQFLIQIKGEYGHSHGGFIDDFFTDNGAVRVNNQPLKVIGFSRREYMKRDLVCQ